MTLIPSALGGHPPEARSLFYAVLSHTLTVCIRDVLNSTSTSTVDLQEQLSSVFALNEVLHRSTSQAVQVLEGRGTTDSQFGRVAQEYVGADPRSRAALDWAIQSALKAVES